MANPLTTDSFWGAYIEIWWTQQYTPMFESHENKKKKNKMKPTNPNAHTYDNENPGIEVMTQEKRSVKCGV